MEKAISVTNLTKIFGTYIAVDSISFEVNIGEIFGFLGANGAGKSTTIRMLCGILEPTSGDAIVAGYSILKDPESVKKNIGYMSQKITLYKSLTVSENITFFAGLYGLEMKLIETSKSDILNQMGILEYENKLITELTPGIKQFVALACALIHKPKIIFLDEPTAGVDPLLRIRFWELIKQLSLQGTTIFITTHYMDEVEYCDRIAFMNEGKIVTRGSIKELRSLVFSNPIIEIEIPNLNQVYQKSISILNKFGEVSIYGSNIHLICDSDLDYVKDKIQEILKNEKISFSRIIFVEPNIEDIFFRLIKR